MSIITRTPSCEKNKKSLSSGKEEEYLPIDFLFFKFIQSHKWRLGKQRTDGSEQEQY